MPDLSFGRDRDHRKEPGRRQLLALHRVRRRVERFAEEDHAAVSVPKLALIPPSRRTVRVWPAVYFGLACGIFRTCPGLILSGSDN